MTSILCCCCVACTTTFHSTLEQCLCRCHARLADTMFSSLQDAHINEVALVRLISLLFFCSPGDRSFLDTLRSRQTNQKSGKKCSSGWSSSSSSKKKVIENVAFFGFLIRSSCWCCTLAELIIWQFSKLEREGDRRWWEINSEWRAMAVVWRFWACFRWILENLIFMFFFLLLKSSTCLQNQLSAFCNPSLEANSRI